MIQNPILPGFNPDPCITRKGDTYYIATSTFEWYPGIAIYESKDLVNYKLLTHVVHNETDLDLRMLPSAKGVWAPDITWNEKEQLFYVCYTRMISHNARFFDQDNFLVTAPDIMGPWSEPVYIHSIGFDPALFHDDDGKKYVVALEWEFRDGYEKPGVIALQEWDNEKKEVVGIAQRIWTGGTDRGCIEGPRIYKRNGFYYVVCAEGGTGYGHSVTVGRSTNIWGPYEADPQGPVITSTPDFYGRDSDWFLKTQCYNPDSVLQKSGHGSLVETQTGEWYMTHLTARPFLPELRCTLGRETAIQKMAWTDDNWIRMKDGTKFAKLEVEAPNLPIHEYETEPFCEDFDANWNVHFISPRTDFKKWASLTERKGFLRLHGQQSLCSLDKVSLVARRLTSTNAVFGTRVEFSPQCYQHSAGLVLYYDNMNWMYLRIYYSDTLQSPALALMQCENGEKRELLETRIALPKDKSVNMKCEINARETQFYYNIDEARIDFENIEWQQIGPVIDTSLYSDEYSKFGEFTGTFAGICCTDTQNRKTHADFDYFCYR